MQIVLSRANRTILSDLRLNQIQLLIEKKF